MAPKKKLNKNSVKLACEKIGAKKTEQKSVKLSCEKWECQEFDGWFLARFKLSPLFSQKQTKIKSCDIYIHSVVVKNMKISRFF